VGLAPNQGRSILPVVMALQRIRPLVSAIAICTLTAFAFVHSAVSQSAPQAGPASTGPVYVGLVEDDRRELTILGNGHTVPGQKSLDDPVPGRNVTPYFVRDNSGWKQVQQLNQKIRWTVAFDGKNLGQIESEPIPEIQARPKGVPGPSCVHAILTPPSKVPSVGLAKGGFNGNFGAYVRRPLVAVSKANFVDPEHWKHAKLPDQVAEQVRAVFRKTFGHVRQCDSSGGPLSRDSKVSDSEIVVLKAYGSTKGSFIVETQLKDHRCVFNMNGTKLQLLEGDQWYYVRSVGEVIFLARDWQLVDAGDYDDDGKSEVIFYVAESKDDVQVENEGYILFYDDFRASVRFTWSETADIATP
jgi:hypothetical protein